MTQLMTTTIKVVMYTISVVCAILAIRSIINDYAFEAVVQTLGALIAYGQAKTCGDGTTD